MSKALGGLIFGIILGYILHIPANEKVCAIIFLSALDAIFGGIAAKLNLTFSNRILISDFFANTIFGLLLIFFGNFFGIDLYYVAIFIFVLRIFKNFSTLKQALFGKRNT